MSITKEFEIDVSDFSDQELIEELTDRVYNTGILFTVEAQKQLEKHKEEYEKNLSAILDFIRNPSCYV